MPQAAKTHRARAQPTKRRDYRKTAAQRGYGSKWQTARKRFLQQHPYCVGCDKEGRVTLANVVDHITPHRGDDKLFWDHGNWQALCRTCHNRKTGSGR
ncbi:HNH endonuclease [Symmachiella macrocystis]|uniref:Putative HNH nuclease YajD n=1 Tax=Symmachiella macrocystis TaxID=2527985 RepID=A0A5C6B9S7_9PLAN|nr:HNH endonuclease signature motif containing protein [Symmachiella macrocystis]TWU08843.1 HNH endonuclease [Symmachiella macrocystis]